MLQYDLKNRTKLPKHLDEIDLCEVRTRHHNRITQHSLGWFTMFFYYVTQFCLCAPRLFCSAFFCCCCCSSDGRKRQTYGSSFPVKKRQANAVTNHRKSVGKAQVQRGIEVMELQSLHIITQVSIVLCSYILRIYSYFYLSQIFY